jgi:hypothetical protein
MLDETYAAIQEANKEIADLKAEILHLRTERERELGNDMLRVLHDCAVMAYTELRAENTKLRTALSQHMQTGCKCRYCQDARTALSVDPVFHHPV